MDEKEPIITQEVKDAVEKIKALVKKGNVTKIVIKKDETTILNLPLNAGLIGGIALSFAAPWAMLAVTLATIGFDCKVELIESDGRVTDISPKTLGKQVLCEIKADDQ
ncbi:MAG: DUF4342 domain-containing protein [Clostridiales bacterium]|nr:DUF4342 domain-containing protein [Clostridiales bacterium]